MASSSTPRASSSTSNCDRYNYDVFLSFRGEDTRNNFTDHLYATLVAYGIHTFRDEEELEKGGEIASDLSRAIEESKIFVIIFSRNYADSKWCLNELVKIIDCMTQKKSTVLPVFYHVEPREVRNQRGSFEKAFVDHAKDADQEKEKTIETWKNALKTAASLKGYHVTTNQSEAEFIQKIREDIITRLNRKPLHVGENIVGMDFHLEQLKSRIKIELDEVHMVGTYGTGGIGKTTIAMAIYNDISSQFDGSSFLKNVGGKGEDGLLNLQKTLLQDILKDKEQNFSNTNEGINAIKEKLRSKRVLIVLDDVANCTELENLAGKYGWYGAKSLIIITTRDKHLLKEDEVNAVYEVQKLNHEKSTELFNWWAFKKNTPTPEFKSLSDSIVKYADGLPIALKVLGGFLNKKSTDHWKSELRKLEKMPDRTVQSVLKVSYDRLDDMEQGMFLDIACFFRGEDKDFVSRILGSCAGIVIEVLHDRCLINISENKLDMHDLLQQMGREIVRQQCLEEPGKRSRLWHPNDVDSVLTRNTGTKAIEGLFVDISASNMIQFSTFSFTKLNRLRLLKVCSYWWSRLEVQLPMDFEFPSLELRYLHFDRYPLESLPTNFDAKNLVELNLRHSNIKQPWKKNEILHNLKVIDLGYSKDLVEIPDFSSVPNLEFLILRGCESLVSLPEIKGNMSELIKIDLSDTAIKELPSSIGHLRALKHLNLNSCKKLVSLPESIGNLSTLIEIDLIETAIKELPSSIGHLEALKHLNLNCCKELVSLPESIGNLSTLIEIDLSETDIEELPSSIGNLEALKQLNLYCCRELVSLPESIGNLSTLIEINLCQTAIKELPESIGNLSTLIEIDLSETDIKELPSSIGNLEALKHLYLKCCRELVSLPESIGNLSSLETLAVLKCRKLEGLKVTVGLKSWNPTCRILKGRICWMNGRYSSLKTLNLQHNKMEGEVLNHHVFHLSSLVELCIRNSIGIERGSLSDSSHLSSLKVSSSGNSNPMARGILSDIFHQISWESLSIYHSSLVELSLSNCNLMDGEILNHVFHLSSLKRLNLEGNHFSSIPAGISQLSHLCGLNLSHCNKLQGIPYLPSTSLRFLDVHCSDGILSSPSLLSIPSLLNCFKSELIQRESTRVGSSEFEGKGMSIVIPRSSGIVKGIKNQRSNEVKIELPQNWYESNDLLGFVICCVYVPTLDGELYEMDSDDVLYEMDRDDVLYEMDRDDVLYEMDRDDEFKKSPFDIACELKIGRNYLDGQWMDELSIKFGRCCYDHNDDSVSDQVWVIYYPKDAIEEKYRSNQWTHFMASFHGEEGTLEVKECGIHPIYCSFKCQRNEECERKLCLKDQAINERVRECRNLESLPSTICESESLIILPCLGCSQLKSLPEILKNVENLRELYLDGTSIKELPTSIEHLGRLQRLNLSRCNNLVSLPETFCYLKSLVFLSCIGCSQLKSFPEILENMENLRELYLDGTAIKELPTSIEHLGGLQVLCLSKCSSLVNLPESICNLRHLKYLNVNLCSIFEKFPENLGSLQCLEVLRVAGFDSNQVLRAIQNDVCDMSSWEALNQSINYFSSIPASISQLSKLRNLDLSHCQKLLQIPELPPSLRLLDVHACPCLETLSSPSSLLGFSLFRCFKSTIEELECGSNQRPAVITILPGNNGIPEWISEQTKGSEITIELPKYWYQNNDFLGFALSFLYVLPPHIEYRYSLKCELNFHGHRYEFLDDLPSKFWSMDGLSSKSWPIGEFWLKDQYSCCHNGGKSNRVLVAYYPKVAIKKEYWSNEWRHLKASLHGHFGTERVKVEECGFHLIYMPNTHVQSSFGTNHWPLLLRENTGFNVKRSRDDAEDHPTENPHPKRSRHV